MAGVSSEIEKLKSRRLELAGMVNATRDPERKDDLRAEMERLQKQIETLEKFYNRKTKSSR